MSKHIVKSHNKTLLLYHAVFPVKYRRKAISPEIAETLKQTCLEITERYEIHFVEIGTDEDHVHFLIQTIPTMQPSSMVATIKSISAKQIFLRHPEVKEMLWGGNFWTSGFYLNTVGQYANEEVIKRYVQNQGKNYQLIHRGQLTLFDSQSELRA